MEAEAGETYKGIVYLDPTNLATECTEEQAKENSTTGKKEGCMKWYVFDDSNDTYTMILDHNTTNYVAWASSTDYGSATKESAKSLGITYKSDSLPASQGSYGNNRGPLTVLSQLKNDTSNWSDELKTPKSYTATWNYSNQSYDYTIDYSGYRARLITAEEVAEITKNDRSTKAQVGSSPEANWGLGSNWFLLDKGTASCYNDDNCDETDTTSKYWWLFNNLGSNGYDYSCQTYGCKEGEISDPYGYWTSSPYAGNSDNAWRVRNYGDLNVNYGVVYNDNLYGLRPVITVSKSKIIS